MTQFSEGADLAEFTPSTYASVFAVLIQVRQDYVARAEQRPIQCIALCVGNDWFDKALASRYRCSSQTLLSECSQPIVAVVDHGLWQRDIAAFERAAHPRQIRKALEDPDGSETSAGAPVLRDHDLPPFLHVIKQ
jgi:hypothetical protein